MSEINREVCEEYLDALVTVGLAAKLAQKDGRKVKGTIRATVNALLPRLSDRKVHGIFTGLARQPFPDGALKMLRRQLDSMVGEPA
ncbi:DUF7740 domain-containing protein [Cronobacter malonaticus]|uniref:DUF7740 domain-containing protein n=1 Tax=Cronobacter malonaticus TaxID=413503 RepID=UPI000CFD4B20|nr:hypothetical protein [Cronobacter malonaticus]